MIYPIVIYGNEVLRKQCEEIAPDYPEVKKLVEDMFQTLGEAKASDWPRRRSARTSACSSWTARRGPRTTLRAPTTNGPL